MYPAVQIHNLIIDRQLVLILRYADPDQLVSRGLQFRCDHILQFRDIYREGYKRRRNIDVIEGTGHAVFAADGSKTVLDLRLIRAEKSRKRLAPSLRVFGHSAEVFLEGEMNLVEITACRDNFRDGLCHSVNRSVIRAPA